MSELNEMRITNEDPVKDSFLEERYTNDDVPYNEVSQTAESHSYSEFGPSRSSPGTGDSGNGLLHFSGNLDVTHVAATFLVVAVVAMAVVVDDSPFSAVFDPVTGVISEAFGFERDPGYQGEVEMDIFVTDTDIMYYVMLSEEPDPGKEVRLKVTNTFTDRTEILGENMSGIVSGLRPGLKYTVSVFIGDKCVESRAVTTKTVYEGDPVFTMVYARCYCLEDGTFHFRFDVIDRNNVWSDYTAKLVYTDQTFSECQFAGEPTGPQTIAVNMQMVQTGTAMLVIQCTSTASGQPVTETLYEQSVRI